ncbi:MAG: hypothetical protein JSR55_00230 [Proteobacteria bacterium]|nr:hypothetical protein [Pseudomonadota bacterium]
MEKPKDVAAGCLGLLLLSIALAVCSRTSQPPGPPPLNLHRPVFLKDDGIVCTDPNDLMDISLTGIEDMRNGAGYKTCSIWGKIQVRVESQGKNGELSNITPAKIPESQALGWDGWGFTSDLRN